MIDDETADPGIMLGAPASAEETGDAEALRLRADIAHTRENIGSTIEALQQKLSPAALAEQATTAVREATIGKVEDMVHKAEDTIERTGYSLFDTIRDNPIPAALAGIGIAWLLMRRRSAKSYGYVPGYGYRDTGIRASFQRPRREMDQNVGEEVDDLAERAEGAATDVGRAISDKAGQVGHAISEKAHDAGQAITEKANQVGHTISEKAHDAGQAIKHYAEEAQQTGRRAEDRVEQLYRDNPLAFGAAAIAAGTALGLAIPISRKEDEWLGAARDELVGKAAGMAKEALGKVESTAKDVGKLAGVAEDMSSKAERALDQRAP